MIEFLLSPIDEYECEDDGDSYNEAGGRTEVGGEEGGRGSGAGLRELCII